MSASAVAELRLQLEKDHGTGGEHAFTRSGYFIPAIDFTPVVVGSITYSFAEPVNGIESLRCTSAGAASPILVGSLSLAGYLSVGGTSSALRGGYVTDVTLFYGISTAALTSFATPTLQSITYVAPGTAQGAPVAAAFTLTPVTALQTATNTAGQFYSTRLTTPAAPASAIQADMQKLVVRVSPLTQNTGVFDFVGCLVHFGIA